MFPVPQTALKFLEVLWLGVPSLGVDGNSTKSIERDAAQKRYCGEGPFSSDAKCRIVRAVLGPPFQSRFNSKHPEQSKPRNNVSSETWSVTEAPMPSKVRG